MSKEGRDLINEAVSDAKAIREAAVQAAKNEMLEDMSPRIKQLVEKSIKGALSQNEDTDRIRRGVEDNWPGESHTGFEESKKSKGEKEMADKAPEADQELDLESIGSFFSEAAVDEGGEIPTLGEGDEPGEGEVKAEAKKGKKDDEEDLDEEVEISESELRKVYEAAIQTEVTVKKGFSEMTPNGELEDVVKDADKGVLDIKKGEHMHDKETPPAKQDFMVKEMIQKGLAENKALRENLKKAVGMIKTLGSKLHEVNLFNAKVLHVNKLLNKARLTTEQKKVVLESIDKAKSISEVKTVYEAISNSFATITKLQESASTTPKANTSRARTSGSPDQKVLSESVDKEANGQTSRWAQLAGLSNLK